jgi:hypothetical protein
VARQVGKEGSRLLLRPPAVGMAGQRDQLPTVGIQGGNLTSDPPRPLSKPPLSASHSRAQRVVITSVLARARASPSPIRPTRPALAPSQSAVMRREPGYSAGLQAHLLNQRGTRSQTARGGLKATPRTASWRCGVDLLLAVAQR